jgi:DNA-binding MarR family transcriptional regulator
MKNETTQDQALDVLIDLMEFYHEKLFKAEYEELTGIQVAQFRLLIQLHNTPMLPMSTLGKMLYISRPYMTSLVDSLVQENLVERHYNPHDRRVINVSISEKGREKLLSIRNRIRKQLKCLISGLQESDLQILCTSGKDFTGVVSKIH